MSISHRIAAAIFATLSIATASYANDESGRRSNASLPMQLVAGQRVKVEGRTQDGVFRAEQVTLRDADASAKVEGAVASVSPDRRRLQMLGFEVILDRATRLYRGSQRSASRSAIAPGAWIEAKGTWRRGVLHATRIRVKDTAASTEEIEGSIESADLQASTLVILSRRVVVPAGVPVVDERTGKTETAAADRLRRDDDDGEGRQPIVLGNVLLGGRLEGGFLDEENFEVGQRDSDRAVLSRAQLLASSQINDTIEAYAKLSLNRSLASGGGSGEAEVSEAYVMLHRIAGRPVDLQIGRQRFRDSREWLFDEYLDAARVHVTLPAVKFQAAVSQGILSGPRETRDRRDQLQFIAGASTDVYGVQVNAYTIRRRDKTRGEQPTWFGATVSGRAGIAWNYWTDAALRRGTAGAKQLRGWALDSGVKRKWANQWTPTLTLGYALASGDPTRSDNVDTRFRQTDLEDNSAYYGGLRRVALYGELFDPELTNLQVLTAAIGIRPRRTLALDAVYHHYRQAVATSSLPSGNLDGSLTGKARALGHELDFVVTLRAIAGVDLDLSSGVFVPGPAFEARTRPAFFWRPQVRFYF